MALQTIGPLGQFTVAAFMSDSSAVSSAFAVAPRRAKLIGFKSVMYNAITVADSVITFKVNAVAVTTVAAHTLTQSGSAAGDVDTSAPAAQTFIQPDQTIEFISDGGGTTTCPTMFYAIFQNV